MDIKTAGRTLDVFEAFETLRKPMTLSELAKPDRRSRVELPWPGANAAQPGLPLHGVRTQSALPDQEAAEGRDRDRHQRSDPCPVGPDPGRNWREPGTVRNRHLGKRLDTRGGATWKSWKGRRPYPLWAATAGPRSLPLHSRAYPQGYASHHLRTRSCRRCCGPDLSSKRVTEHTDHAGGIAALNRRSGRSRARGYYVTRDEKRPGRHGDRPPRSITIPAQGLSFGIAIARADPPHGGASRESLARTLEEAGTRIRFDENHRLIGAGLIRR